MLVCGAQFQKGVRDVICPVIGSNANILHFAKGTLTMLRRTILQRTALLACNSLVACTALPQQVVDRNGDTPGPAPRVRGCCIWGNAAAISAATGSMTEQSGNPRLDSAIGDLLVEMVGLLAVRPGFAFYDDGGSPNAVAIPRSEFAASGGTVLFGLTMLARIDSQMFGDMFVQAICAHEFAHIYQYQTSYYSRLSGQDTIKPVELHADILAGFYLGSVTSEIPADQLISLGRAWETLGDTDFTRPEHHGTSEERIAAMEAGFDFGRRHIGLEAAAEAGARYLGS